jgi:hypothetical protein
MIIKKRETNNYELTAILGSGDLYIRSDIEYKNYRKSWDKVSFLGGGYKLPFAD